MHTKLCTYFLVETSENDFWFWARSMYWTIHLNCRYIESGDEMNWIMMTIQASRCLLYISRISHYFIEKKSLQIYGKAAFVITRKSTFIFRLDFYFFINNAFSFGDIQNFTFFISGCYKGFFNSKHFFSCGVLAERTGSTNFKPIYLN